MLKLSLTRQGYGMKNFQCALLLGLALGTQVGCSSETPGSRDVHDDWPCEIAAGTAKADVPDSVAKVGCAADFQALSSLPLDASIPGARSAKVVYDLRDGTLYFQNSQRHAIHFDFVRVGKNAKGEVLFTGGLDVFNPQYTLPVEQRTFMLGAVTYYEQPKIWALEIAPYDNATPAMIETLYRAVRDHAFYGPALDFHPTSQSVERTAKTLASDVSVVTTDQIYAAIDYQPLNVGEAVGTLKILSTADLAADKVYVSIRDIVVLDAVPNDISPVAGIITEEFQTPLSHINVLARNRGTPNMGLRGATKNPKIKPLDGKPVRIKVDAFGWEIEGVTQAEADDWFEEHAPEPVTVPKPNLTVKDLRDVELVTEHTDVSPYVTFDAIKAATQAFGAKTANYSVFATDKLVPNKKAFGIPVYYYHQFMTENGIFAKVAEWRADPAFTGDPAERDKRLATLRDSILVGEFSAEFTTALKAKLDADFPGVSMRFRSSTNAEDLDAFPCAGCYDSHTGDPSDKEFGGDQMKACLQAIRKTWATVWNQRTYEEREIRKMIHEDVAMGLLVHTNFPAEEANGVAITANIFDETGNAPGFYVNVQYGGEYEVVHAPPGVTSDSFLYQFTYPNQPIIYYTSSNVKPPSLEHVLTDRQVHELGVALDRLHTRFANAYRPAAPGAWYAIDSEFKFDDFENPGAPAKLYIKQARPYPKNSSVSSGD